MENPISPRLGSSGLIDVPPAIAQQDKTIGVESVDRFHEDILEIQRVKHGLIRLADINWMKGDNFKENWQKYISTKLLKELLAACKNDRVLLEHLLSICDFHEIDLINYFIQKKSPPSLNPLMNLDKKFKGIRSNRLTPSHLRNKMNVQEN